MTVLQKSYFDNIQKTWKEDSDRASLEGQISVTKEPYNNYQASSIHWKYSNQLTQKEFIKNLICASGWY